MLKVSEILSAPYDFWRSNQYGLKKYLINDSKKHRFAIICPGGAYGMVCSFLEGQPYAKALNKEGYHAFVLYYRIGKKALYPAPQDDLERAIREVFEHAKEWKLDTSCWSLWGSSAGGHLVSSFCTEDRKVQKPGTLVLCYPVITMGDHTHKGSCRNLLGKNPDKEMIDRLSVERHIDSDYPPTYLWCGTADQVVEPVNSEMLAEALKNNGVRYKFDELKDIGHGTGLGNDLPWFKRAVKFWEENQDLKGR